MRFTEFHSGFSRSSNYYFVINGNKLIPLVNFAKSKSGYYDYVTYEVDLDNVPGETVELSVSNRGHITLSKFNYPFSISNSVFVPLSILNNLDFTYLDNDEKRFLQGEWREYYLPMLNFIRQLNEAVFPSLLNNQIKYANYPLSFLLYYSKKAREKSLENLTKQIHQVWLATFIASYYHYTRKALISFNPDFTQSSYYAIATVNCHSIKCGIWYEFDMQPHTMCRGVNWWGHKSSQELQQFRTRVEEVKSQYGLKTAPIRPDIVILSYASNCDEIMQYGLHVDTIIELKNSDFCFWQNSIYQQIVPYKQIFSPRQLIVASLKPVPKSVKTTLSNQGITIIDEVHPNGDGLKQLLQLLP
ncbi:hypothetical protein SJAV_27010 [Sulfurisphaera javensis]|uniref:Uncharacterized protein n=1 Tax=Sulfurisphaera javensis TaxID=2049879 RepID=A0AAT9GV43_9CREN